MAKKILFCVIIIKVSLSMMNRITALYPQYQRSQDRRQQNIPVAVDRRSGNDRRGENRVNFDKQLTRDLYEVKSKISQLESIAPKLFENSVTTKAPTFSSMNNMTQDLLVKESKPDNTAIARQQAKLQSTADTSFKIGIIAAALAASIAVSFMGPAGAVIAVGTGCYIGARVLKTMVEKELKDRDDKDTKKTD